MKLQSSQCVPVTLKGKKEVARLCKWIPETHKVRDHHKTSNIIQNLFPLLTKFLLSFQPQTGFTILPHFELTFLSQSTADPPNVTPAPSSLTFLVAFPTSAANSSSSLKLQVSSFPIHSHGHYHSLLPQAAINRMSTVLSDISIIRQCWCLGNTSNAGPSGYLCSRLTTPSTCPFSKDMPALAEYYLWHCSGVGLGTEISLYSCLPPLLRNRKALGRGEKSWNVCWVSMSTGTARTGQRKPSKDSGGEDPISTGEGYFVPFVGCKIWRIGTSPTTRLCWPHPLSPDFSTSPKTVII